MPQKNKFGAKIPDNFTQAFQNFCLEAETCETLMIFLKIGNIYIAENKQRSKDMLISIYDDKSNPISRHHVKCIESTDLKELLRIENYQQYFGQMAFARSIDNFISYFKDILSEIVISNPNILKSQETESLEFILNYSSFEDLVKAIADKQIERLFYKGINDIEIFFIKKLGIPLFKDDTIKFAFNFLNKKRNLIVHNRGKITKDFVREFPSMKDNLGQYLLFSYDDISIINLSIHNFLVDLDREISEKFNLNVIENYLQFEIEREENTKLIT